jgi:transposase-like protein
MSKPLTNRYKNHRFPAEIIGLGVWLYFRFCLSYAMSKNSCSPEAWS